MSEKVPKYSFSTIRNYWDLTGNDSIQRTAQEGLLKGLWEVLRGRALPRGGLRAQHLPQVRQGLLEPGPERLRRFLARAVLFLPQAPAQGNLYRFLEKVRRILEE